MYGTNNGFVGMGNFNPMNYQQPVQQQFQQPAGFSTRPVTSREEAVAAQVDFMGPGTLLPDLGHGVIYLKRFNQNTGASDLFEFRMAQPEEPRDELGELKAAVKRLEEEMERMKGNAE